MKCYVCGPKVACKHGRNPLGRPQPHRKYVRMTVDGWVINRLSGFKAAPPIMSDREAAKVVPLRGGIVDGWSVLREVK